MIDTARDLDALVDRCLAAEAVALDTEFVWERTYVPALGVVQVGLGPDDVHVLDAVALDLAPLGRVLEAAGTQILLHDATQDLQILARATGARPRNVFDTQRVAGLAGLSGSVSLQDLVEWATGVRLEKGETRTDWLRRPLSDKQVEYALDDVRYLPAVRERLLAEADARGPPRLDRRGDGALRGPRPLRAGRPARRRRPPQGGRHRAPLGAGAGRPAAARRVARARGARARPHAPHGAARRGTPGPGRPRAAVRRRLGADAADGQAARALRRGHPRRRGRAGRPPSPRRPSAAAGRGPRTSATRRACSSRRRSSPAAARPTASTRPSSRPRPF